MHAYVICFPKTDNPNSSPDMFWMAGSATHPHSITRLSSDPYDAIKMVSKDEAARVATALFHDVESAWEIRPTAKHFMMQDDAARLLAEDARKKQDAE